ncbi:hypothetical protein L3X38_024636 [Prunus dulcis]|uniref:Uncharacterized protein n=1 Tax=Prunus dulcis TaxID=3755 RepID=A0AAD4W096_PRUDU|nr:hypothetical protein L3X38_024636 [Prunus dulcis]
MPFRPHSFNTLALKPPPQFCNSSPNMAAFSQAPKAPSLAISNPGFWQTFWIAQFQHTGPHLKLLGPDDLYSSHPTILYFRKVLGWGEFSQSPNKN